MQITYCTPELTINKRRNQAVNLYIEAITTFYRDIAEESK